MYPETQPGRAAGSSRGRHCSRPRPAFRRRADSSMNTPSRTVLHKLATLASPARPPGPRGRVRRRPRQRRRHRRRRGDREDDLRPLDDDRRQVRRPAGDARSRSRRTFKACVATKRKTLPKQAKGQPKVTDTQLKTQCKQEYEALRDQVLQLLISFQWIQGEAEDLGVKVSDAEVKKQFDTQKKASFPKEADFDKFLKDSGPVARGHPAARPPRRPLEQDPREGHQGQGQGHRRRDQEVLRREQAALRPARAARPAGRPDQDQGQGRRGQGGDRGRRRSKDVAKKYSIDQASKAQGGKLAAVAKGQQEKALDDAVFKATQGRAGRPGQDAVRLLRLQGQQGHRRRRSRRWREAKTDDQAAAGLAEAAEGAGQVRQGLPHEVEGQDGVPRGLRDAGLHQRAEGEGDADGRARARCRSSSSRPRGASARRPRRRRPTPEK